MQTAVLVMWNEFIKTEGEKIISDLRNRPVVIGRRVKVIFYNGNLTPNLQKKKCLLIFYVLSYKCIVSETEISTKVGSVLLVNPPIQEAMRLKNW